jgi:hypothetical protein
MDNLKNLKLYYKTEYRSFTNMKNRCYNVNCKDYEYAGKKGIKVSSSWKESFLNFIQDMGKKPAKHPTHGKYTLGRINNNQHYCKQNCLWLPMKQQAKNRNPRKVKNTNSNQLKLL